MARQCPDCNGIRTLREHGLWCSWCKMLEETPDVRKQLQNEWD